MKKIIMLAAIFVAAACRQNFNSACAVLTGGSGRCDYEHSAIAAVLFESPNGSYSVCTGTLITKNAVLTAAHCVGAHASEPSRFKVHSGGALQRVRRLAVHPHWSGGGPSPNDLALVFLEADSPGEPVALDMSIAVLPGVNMAVFSHSEGLETALGRVPGRYRAALMQVDSLSPAYFTASFAEPGFTVCAGNSGSPAIVQSPKHQPGLVGIVSFALERCSPQSRAGLIRIRSDDNLEFILREAPGVKLSR